jgi:hypothetical protein
MIGLSLPNAQATSDKTHTGVFSCWRNPYLSARLPQTGERFYKICASRNAFGELRYFNGELARGLDEFPWRDGARRWLPAHLVCVRVR